MNRQILQRRHMNGQQPMKRLGVFSHQGNANQPLRETPGTHRAEAVGERHEPSHNTGGDLKQLYGENSPFGSSHGQPQTYHKDQPLTPLLDTIHRHRNETFAQ